MNAYVGWRGSIRYKLYHPGHSVACIKRYDTQADTDFRAIPDAATIQPDVSNVEIPFYSHKRFALTRSNPTFAGSSLTDPFDPNYAGITTLKIGSAVVDAKVCSAVGEDFSLFFFLGFPPLYVNA